MAQGWDFERNKRVVHELLDHWDDFFAIATSGSLVVVEHERPMGDDWTLLSSMSRHVSVVELARCLEAFRGFAPGPYGRLVEYLRSPWRTVDRPVRRRDARGRLVDDVARVRERVVSGGLARVPRCTERVQGERCSCGGAPRTVCRAVDFVVGGLWDRRVPVELPLALTRKLRALSDSDGWTEAA
jgi:hypothetical protein